MSRFICHRRVLGKRLYVNRVGSSTRDWGYDHRPAHAKPLTAAQMALFQSDMDYMKTPFSCGVAQEDLGRARKRRRR